MFQYPLSLLFSLVRDRCDSILKIFGLPTYIEFWLEQELNKLNDPKEIRDYIVRMAPEGSRVLQLAEAKRQRLLDEAIETSTKEKCANTAEQEKHNRNIIERLKRAKNFSQCRKLSSQISKEEINKNRPFKNVDVILLREMRKNNDVDDLKAIMNLADDNSEIYDRAEEKFNSIMEDRLRQVEDEEEWKRKMQSVQWEVLTLALIDAPPHGKFIERAHKVLVDQMNQNEILREKKHVDRYEDEVEFESLENTNDIKRFIARRQPGDYLFNEAIFKLRKSFRQESDSKNNLTELATDPVVWTATISVLFLFLSTRFPNLISSTIPVVLATATIAGIAYGLVTAAKNYRKERCEDEESLKKVQEIDRMILSGIIPNVRPPQDKSNKSLAPTKRKELARERKTNETGSPDSISEQDLKIMLDRIVEKRVHGQIFRFRS